MSGQSFMWRIQECDDENEAEVHQIWKTADKSKNNIKVNNRASKKKKKSHRNKRKKMI